MSATTRISSRPVFETVAAARSAGASGGHDHVSGHGHAHHHDGHSHDPVHGHHHRDGRDHPPRAPSRPALRAVRISPSLIRAGLAARLGAAAVLLVAVWGLTALVTG